VKCIEASTGSAPTRRGTAAQDNSDCACQGHRRFWFVSKALVCLRFVHRSNLSRKRAWCVLPAGNGSALSSVVQKQPIPSLFDITCLCYRVCSAHVFSLLSLCICTALLCTHLPVGCSNPLLLGVSLHVADRGSVNNHSNHLQSPHIFLSLLTTLTMASKLCCTAEEEGRSGSPVLPNARVSAPTPANRPLLPGQTGSPNSRFTSARSDELHELRQIFDNAQDDASDRASSPKAPRPRSSRPSIYSLHSLHKMTSMRSILRRKFSKDLSRKNSRASTHRKSLKKAIDECPETQTSRSGISATAPGRQGRLAERSPQ
jgi:hypothetical protein